MKKLYNYFVDCGKMGSVESVFICDEKEVEKIVGKEIYHGEILGKHSEIFFPFTMDMVKVVDLDENDIQTLCKIFDVDTNFEMLTISGHNPVETWEENNWEEELNEDDDE